MRESIKIKNNTCNFKFRVAGILIYNSKILFVRANNDDFYCLPGGYVELGETTITALLREMEEELGFKVKINKYLGIIENFFINKNEQKVQEICIYYEVGLEDINTANLNDYSLIENDKGRLIHLNFKWLNINELANYNIKPIILKDIIKNNNITINHIIINEIN